MAKQLLSLGPVLSFRGIGPGDTWQVTALVGIQASEPAPVMRLDATPCPGPVTLLEHKGERYLRYDLTCAQADAERKVPYALDGHDATWHFTVPAKGHAPRMAYVSCNGFSDPSSMRKLVRPENEVWSDLLCNHDRQLRPPGYLLDKEQVWHETRTHDLGLQRFHLLMMGGDQIYFDSIWEDVKPLKDWVGLSRDEQLQFPVGKALDREIESYYFSLYARRWLPPKRKGWGGADPARDTADALARMPTVMVWDDHDIFDGWGSYSPQMQRCPLFQAMFRHARRAFWVFQMQHALQDLPDLVPEPRTDISSGDPRYAPIDWTAHRAKDPLALPILDQQPGFSAAWRLGTVALVAADLRTERSRTQVLAEPAWKALRGWLDSIDNPPPGQPGARCQHLVLMSSVPVAHPKLSLAEGLLDTFGQDHVLDSNADDLKDHWSHDDHEGERKRLLETLLDVGRRKRLRVSIVSGDVHVAALGTVFRRDLPLTETWAQIHQFTSSAVVHPSLVGVAERLFLHLLNAMAGNPQHIDIQHAVEMLLFPGHNRRVMPARNWLALELDPSGSTSVAGGPKLWATWRCETETRFSNHLHAVHPAAPA